MARALTETRMDAFSDTERMESLVESALQLFATVAFMMEIKASQERWQALNRKLQDDLLLARNCSPTIQ